MIFTVIIVPHFIFFVVLFFFLPFIDFIKFSSSSLSMEIVFLWINDFDMNEWKRKKWKTETIGSKKGALTKHWRKKNWLLSTTTTTTKNSHNNTEQPQWNGSKKNQNQKKNYWQGSTEREKKCFEFHHHHHLDEHFGHCLCFDFFNGIRFSLPWIYHHRQTRKNCLLLLLS